MPPNNTSELFHHSFLSILRETDPLFERCKQLEQTNTQLFNTNFDMLPKTAESVIEIAPLLLRKVKRAQTLIDSTADYYVASDNATSTVYMCYRDVLMIDIDLKHQELEAAEVLDYFDNIPNYAFKIFQSARGFHVFCISQRFHYRDPLVIQFMLSHFADFYYTVYAYIRGFSVRLNPKFNDGTDRPIYQELGTVGDRELIDKDVLALVDRHIELCKRYKNQLSIVS
ncbi:MAG: hypothetical protein EBU90_04885 [Proteobacteria bacterium]|nr:hypothetical protein [Pseudomonadota bacterium]NBP13746.1 hypothetical protein [bacterium]